MKADGKSQEKQWNGIPDPLNFNWIVPALRMDVMIFPVITAQSCAETRFG
jgi:hypothetical protein